MTGQDHFDGRVRQVMAQLNSTDDGTPVGTQLQEPPVMEQGVSQIAELLQTLDEVAAESGLSNSTVDHEPVDQLAEARLGVASGLFTSIRHKHPPTARHSLRVALGCSAWARALELPESYRNSLEVAALLHDVGKIGVPDAILCKPGKLTQDEEAYMAQHWDFAQDILESSCGTPDVLQIIQHATCWYDGSRRTADHTGEELPFGARMLAIVDAYDAMTTDHVYRPARSQERAFAELFACAGTQFDPTLVRSFAETFSKNPQRLFEAVAGDWLESVTQRSQLIKWAMSTGQTAIDPGTNVAELFEAKLIGNMHDGVIFVDSQCRMFVWNTGAERMTGVASTAAEGRNWSPSLFDMRDVKGKKIENEACPVARAIDSGVQSITRLNLLGRSGRDVTVDLHAIPVRSSDGTCHGATILLHDASPEASLEERCQALHEEATKDPLTKVANRAEFDRMHQLFIEAHLESGLPCSLIITDIDHFKQVNDVYGHQAGDDAIKSVASLLKDMCRSGDLVARYGGEEFVVLCADCNNAAATRRAEELRRGLAEMDQPMLGNRRITASFGVTELQAGDSTETMLRRADRALLLAKDQGRNQVVQLGDGMQNSEEKKSWWPFQSRKGRALIDTHLVTDVPIEVAVQKLRGFIADHAAKIDSTGEDHLHLEISGDNVGALRRQDDRPVGFQIEMKFEQRRESRNRALGHAAGEYVQTRAHLVIRPKRDRDRQNELAVDQARLLLRSMKSYLMAKEDTGEGEQPAESTAEAVAS